MSLLVTTSASVSRGDGGDGVLVLIVVGARVVGFEWGVAIAAHRPENTTNWLLCCDDGHGHNF